MYPKAKMLSSKPNFESDDLFTSVPRVTVKFKLSQDRIFTLPFTIETSTFAVKEQLSCMLQIPITDLSLSIDSVVMSDVQTLADFATAKCGTIIMNLHTSHTVDLNALAQELYGDMAVRDVMSVTVDMGEGKDPEHILVDIIKENFKKDFIGGYRHCLNGKEYHHVSSQTAFFSKSNVVRFERDVQTGLDTASKHEGTYGTKATQTPIKGLYLIEPLNIELTPREYVSTREIKEKVLMLQKYWCRWLLRTKMKSDRFQVREALEEEGELCKEEQLLLETGPCSLQPGLRKKIDNCNGEIGSFEEVSQIFTGTLRTYFGNYVLKREIEEFHASNKDRRCASKILIDQQNLNLIKKFCKPLTWIGEQGNSLSVETEHHRRLSNWYEVYRQYTSDELSVQEKRSLIIVMQEMLEKMGEWDNPRIQDLLSEQLDMLNIGVDNKCLSALQNVTGKYLMAFLKDYGSKYCIKIQSEDKLNNKCQVFACKYCKRVKLQSSFRGKSKMNRGNECRSCFWLENMSRQRVDYAVYRSILLSIRREEEKHICLFSVAFVMQEEDICYIVNTIWHGKSVLSETKDVSCLRLSRFDNAIAWSPWNCFLITEKEMRAHQVVENPLEVYGSWLFEQVRTKHLMARLHFQHLWRKTSQPMKRKTWQSINKSYNMLKLS